VGCVDFDVSLKMTTFTLSEADYIKACFRLARTSLIVRFFIITVIFGFAILSESSFGMADYIGSGIVILLIATFLPYLFWKRKIKKLYRAEVALQLPATLIISENSYKLENDRNSSLTYWSDIKKYIETSDFYLLFTSKQFARIIPKQVLSREDRSLLTKHLKQVG